MYDTTPSTRVGIYVINGKDRRVYEVLGGYGEGISAKDFKLQVQAEKALDAHAKGSKLKDIKNNTNIEKGLKERPKDSLFLYRKL